MVTKYDPGVHLHTVEATAEHGEASKTGNEPTSKSSPSCKGSPQVCSNQADTGDRPGKNETREEAAQSKREESEAEDEGAEVVGG